MGLVIGASLLLAACGQRGFLGCRNVIAFSFQDAVFNTELVSNRLLYAVDPYNNAAYAYLVLEAFGDDGSSFYLELTDFSNSGFGNCIPEGPLYANETLNFCLPGVPFACNGFYALFTDAEGNEYVQTGGTGQVVVNTCDPQNQRITGNFTFAMEDFDSGDQGLLTGGSFAVCFAL